MKSKPLQSSCSPEAPLLNYKEYSNMAAMEVKPHTSDLDHVLVTAGCQLNRTWNHLMLKPLGLSLRKSLGLVTKLAAQTDGLESHTKWEGERAETQCSSFSASWLWMQCDKLPQLPFPCLSHHDGLGGALKLWVKINPSLSRFYQVFCHSDKKVNENKRYLIFKPGKVAILIITYIYK